MPILLQDPTLTIDRAGAKRSQFAHHSAGFSGK